MRLDSLLLNTLSVVTHFGLVGTQFSRCKDIPYSLGMSDLVNFGCKLVRGMLKLKFKNICEGEPCPGLGANTICANGKCIDRSGGSGIRPRLQPPPQSRPSAGERTHQATPSAPLATPRPRTTRRRRPIKGAGRLNVTIISASLANTDTFINAAADAYIVLCSFTGDKRESTGQPLDDRDNCFCRTTKREDNNEPYWEHQCEPFDLNQYNQSTTVLTFEAYDTEVIADDEFIAGNDITIKEVIDSGNNGIPLELPLYGPYSGSVTVNITWTAIK